MKHRCSSCGEPTHRRGKCSECISLERQTQELIKKALKATDRAEVGNVTVKN